MNITNELNRIDQYQEIPDMDAGCQADFAMLAKIVRDCHRAGFVTDAGEVRRVLDDSGLPTTADGCIAIPDRSVVYHRDHLERTLDVTANERGVFGELAIGNSVIGFDWHTFPIDECYGSQAAAEAGRGEGK